MPNIKSAEKKIVVGLTLTESEIRKLDALAQKVRQTRSGHAAYLLVQAIEAAAEGRCPDGHQHNPPAVF